MIHQELRDPEHSARLAGLAPDGVTIFTLEGDSIRGALVSSTRMTALMAQAHELGQLETLVLGKAGDAVKLTLEFAGKVGKDIAAKALAGGIEKVVFDRNGYLYHGRIKALAEGAREGGLKF